MTTVIGTVGYEDEGGGIIKLRQFYKNFDGEEFFLYQEVPIGEDSFYVASVEYDTVYLSDAFLSSLNEYEEYCSYFIKDGWGDYRSMETIL